MLTMINSVKICLCFFFLVSLNFAQSVPVEPEEEDLNTRDIHKRQAYGVTNYEINESLKQLGKTVRGLENKLSRHEFREVQVADFSTKTLNALNSDHALTQKNMQTVAKQLVKMEDKILSLESLIKTTDERTRHILSELNREVKKASKISSILPPPPPPPVLPPRPGSSKVDVEVKKVLRKTIAIDATLKNNLRRIASEMKLVGNVLNKNMNSLVHRHNILQKNMQNCKKDEMKTIQEVAQELAKTGEIFTFEVSEAKKLMADKEGKCESQTGNIMNMLKSIEESARNQESGLSDFNDNTQKVLMTQKHDLDILVQESKNEREHSESSFNNVLENLNQLKEISKSQLENLEGGIKGIIEENGNVVDETIRKVAELLRVDTRNILTALEDTASQAENLQFSIGENFGDLSKEIRSLKKVEQVMLNTADAVLDTKRSIEFGIQQVILELSEIVRVSGSTINSTLSDQINAISFNILKNQTSALTNMTKKMEEEISQVWKQIGIMYQTVSTSVDLLDQLQDTTNQHMNASLSKVGNMDGTVGKINEKVAGVEDNLNYLLGRVSLAVQEFADMKSGVGEQLEKLRNISREFNEKEKIVEYRVKK